MDGQALLVLVDGVELQDIQVQVALLVGVEHQASVDGVELQDIQVQVALLVGVEHQASVDGVEHQVTQVPVALQDTRVSVVGQALLVSLVTRVRLELLVGQVLQV